MGRRSPGSTSAGRRSRDRILRASLSLVTEVGIDQVRLAEIARRAEMSSGQLIYYFSSKEHIFRGYPAARGWDPVTGPGSPDAEVLVPLLAHLTRR